MSGTAVRGTVLSWDDEAGWGVLTSPDVPGEVWAHFSVVRAREAGEFVSLTPGEPVLFTWEEAEQDGYRLRAVDVRRPGDPPPGPEPDEPSGAEPDEPSGAGSGFDVRVIWDESRPL